MNQYGCPKAVPKNIAEKGIFLSMFSLNGEFVSLKKTLLSLLWMSFNCLKAAEPLLGESLLFTIKFPEIAGIHLMDLGRMKA